MPCNGNNHSASCNCGWGGMNHGGGGGGRGGHFGARSGYSGGGDRWLSDFLERQRLQAMQRLAEEGQRLIKSFMTPNAKCPVCAAPVWFYASPHGGRVYFDDIGWPWPKHPCCDTGSTGRSTHAQAQARPKVEHGVGEVVPSALARPSAPDRAAPSEDISKPLWEMNGDRPILAFGKVERSGHFNILDGYSWSRLLLGNPVEYMTISWPSMTTIDPILPTFLSPVPDEEGMFVLRTVRWVGSDMVPKSFVVCEGTHDVLARIDSTTSRMSQTLN